jgi:hypothetical protein
MPNWGMKGWAARAMVHAPYEAPAQILPPGAQRPAWASDVNPMTTPSPVAAPLPPLFSATPPAWAAPPGPGL